MVKLEFDDEKIEIIEEKKKLFSSELKVSTTTIYLKDIESASRETFEGKLNSTTIIFGENDEEFIDLKSLEKPEELQKLLQYLEEKNIRIENIEI